MRTHFNHIPIAIFRLCTKFFVAVSLLLLILAPVPSFAQTANQGVAGFKACNFTKGQSGTSNLLQGCLRQVFTFAFVVAVFLIAFRVGLAAIDDFNPFTNGNAANDTINLVWEITLGLILIGGPIIILNTINPATLNLNFLNLGSLVQSKPTSTTPNSSTGTTGSTTTTTGTGSTATTASSTTSTGDDKEKFRDAQCTKYPTSRTCANYKKPVTWLTGVNTFAQTSDDDAVKVITNVLTIEVKCKQLFLDQTTLKDCQVIEMPDFVQARQDLPDEARRDYTPLLDAKSTYYSTNYTEKALLITPVTIPLTNLRTNGCGLYFAQVKTQEVGAVPFLVGAEICNSKLDGLAFWKINNGKVETKNGEIIAAGSVISGTNSIIHLIT